MYDLITIKKTIDRILNKDIDIVKLEKQLEKTLVAFTPEIGRMIVISDEILNLPISQRYGTFVGMTDKDEYQISTGRGRYARPLT